MKNKFLTYFIFFSAITVYLNIVCMQDTKNIIIFSSRAGGGHTAVAAAVTKYLEKNLCNIKVIHCIDRILAPVDPIQLCTFGKINSEDCYNFFLRNKFIYLAAALVSVAALGSRLSQKLIVSRIYNEIENAQVDAIISVVPLINGCLLEVAKKLKIPLIVITNDLDTTNYINGLKSPTYKKFCYTLAFNDSNLFKKIENACIPEAQIKVTGFPLRPEFFKKKSDKNSLKEMLKLKEDKIVIMIFMGGAGSSSSYKFVQNLAKSKKAFHLIVCLGKNEKLKSQISKIILPDNISISLIGFTDKIAELMAISDVIITKPGPGSICEAIASNLPIIVDGTQNILWWEKMNVEFVEKNMVGEVVKNIENTESTIEKVLEKNYNKKIKKNMNLLNSTPFEISLQKIVSDLLKTNS